MRRLIGATLAALASVLALTVPGTPGAAATPNSAPPGSTAASPATASPATASPAAASSAAASSATASSESALAGCHPLPGLEVPLRVMTYNIHAGAGEDNVFDLSRTAAMIAAQHPDVVGLQEVDVHWDTRSDFVDEARDLADRLHMRAFFGPIYDLPGTNPGDPRRQYGVAILSRYPIWYARNYEITRLSTQDPNPTPQPAPGFPGVLLNVRGALVQVYDTHLDYRADPAVREAQVADMLAILHAHPGQKLLLGDFNAEPDAAELAPLWGPLVDVLAEVPGAAKPTYPAITPVKRIDYVTVSPGIRICGGYVPETTVGGTQASDHRPVVADLIVSRWPFLAGG